MLSQKWQHPFLCYSLLVNNTCLWFVGHWSDYDMMITCYFLFEECIIVDLIEIIKYVFLGLLQGITEPIPVSSSGHLVIFQHFFNMEIPGLSFELFVNFASLIAVLIIYRQDLARIIKNGWGFLFSPQKTDKMKKDFYFILYLVIGTIPAALIGLLFEDQIASVFKGVRVIGFTLLITGLALWLIRNLNGRKTEGELSFKDAIIVGCAQAVALIPGISRSGATVVASMGMGMNRETALKFSFFLYIPVSLGGMILSISDLATDPAINQLMVPYLFAFVTSLVASFFSLKWFMNIMQKGKLGYFSMYCFIVGTLVIIFA